MKKRLGMATVVAMVLLTAGVPATAGPPNLVGTWKGTGNSIGWGTAGWFYQGFKYDVVGVLFTVDNQDPVTGNFYGNLGETYTGGGYVSVFLFTGNVSSNKTVTIIGVGDLGTVITGTVSGKKFTGTKRHFGSTQIETETFTVYKQ